MTTPSTGELPEEVELRSAMFGDGARGYAMQVYENEKHSVTVVAIREGSGESFVETWTSKRTGEQEFSSFAELRAAFNKPNEEK